MSCRQPHRQQRRSDQLLLPNAEQQQLTAALSPRQMACYFQEWLPPPDAAPVCRVLDMKYTPAEQCTLLYAWGEALWIGTYQWQGAPTAPAAEAHWVAPLGMWLYEFRHDPALPGLATVLTPGAFRDALSAALPHCQSGAFELVRCRATPLRYRPGKRCTVQIDLDLRRRTTGQTFRDRVYGKLYHDAEKARAVYDEMKLLHQTTATQASMLRLAEVVAFLPALGLVIQAPVRGEPLDQWMSQPERLGPSGQTQLCHNLTRPAQALAALHQIELATDRLRTAATDLRKLGERAAKVAAVAPRLGDRLATLAAQLCHHAPSTSAADSCIGHGDCKPSQFLLGVEQVALLDFDHCGMADPAADVGLFLATLRQTALRQQTKAIARKRHTAWNSVPAEAHFLNTYRAARKTPPRFRERVAWYTALALLRKAWRGFARSPWSPLPERLVEEALSIVQ